MQLVGPAAACGMKSIALTDRNNVYGAIAFQQAAKEYGIRPIFGTELTLEEGHYVTLLVRNQAGRANLCRLIRLAQHNAPKGEAALPAARLAEHAEGLIALSGARHGALNQALNRRDVYLAYTLIEQYQNWFGRDGYWIELNHHHLSGDEERIETLIGLAQRHQLG